MTHTHTHRNHDSCLVSLPLFLHTDQVKSFQHGFWIGLSDRNPPGNFQWLGYQGQIIFTHWEKGEPSQTHYRGCVQLHRITWTIRDCEHKYGFICERFAECNKEKYGILCPKPCTPCLNINETCNRRTGQCFYGCEVGFQGATCEDACSNNTFGVNCSENCNPNCRGGSDRTCNSTTGECLYGCADGFVGDRCEIASSSQVIPLHYYHLALAFSLLLIGSLMLGILLPMLTDENTDDEGGNTDYRDYQNEERSRDSTLDTHSESKATYEYNSYWDRDFESWHGIGMKHSHSDLTAIDEISENMTSISTYEEKIQTHLDISKESRKRGDYTPEDLFE
ncbi:multiple epidermal growth factor-like domains 10 [Elysia marginata]|uniref:Multiple epidermal growth factor-like domains 10 n=1 Tax=Elysia marginata TaxID=1093978 RepID=A0AAV4IXT0_9GAST|nr:multiple epidermal growth factor-like domains 10 [Elysia marginata]